MNELKSVSSDGDYLDDSKIRIYVCNKMANVLCLSRIKNFFLRNLNCILWYRDSSILGDWHEDETLISQMQVLVVLIDENSTVRFAGDMLELAYLARNQCITFIPVMRDKRVIDYCDRDVFFRRIQCFFLNDGKLTSEIQSEMRHFIRDHIIKDSEIEKIRKSFSGEIFFSYRKKNRLLINQLINHIHNWRNLRTTIIWNDAFLTIGEDFSEEIRRHSRYCDVAIILVTKDTLEKDNYVIAEEYPYLLSQKKRIFAVITKDVNINEVYSVFPAIERYYQYDNIFRDERYTFEIDLEKAIGEKLYMKSNEYMNDWLLCGEAYLEGIVAEKNVDLGIRMLSDIADVNYLSDIAKLEKALRALEILKNSFLDKNNEIFWPENVERMFSELLACVLERLKTGELIKDKEKKICLDILIRTNIAMAQSIEAQFRSTVAAFYYEVVLKLIAVSGIAEQYKLEFYKSSIALGNISYIQKDYESASKYYCKALERVPKGEYINTMCLLLNAVGIGKDIKTRAFSSIVINWMLHSRLTSMLDAACINVIQGNAKSSCGQKSKAKSCYFSAIQKFQAVPMGKRSVTYYLWYSFALYQIIVCYIREGRKYKAKERFAILERNMARAKASKNCIGILKFNYKVMQLKKTLYPELTEKIERETTWMYSILNSENIL